MNLDDYQDLYNILNNNEDYYNSNIMTIINKINFNSDILSNEEFNKLLIYISNNNLNQILKIAKYNKCITLLSEYNLRK